MSGYLDEKIVKEFLETDQSGRVIKRETHHLEFKSTFDWDNKTSKTKYIKTIAAFANRGGGYLIFGVSNSPKLIQGIDDKFSELDDADISQVLNQFLTPEPIIDRQEFLIKGLKIGVIYVFPSEQKPIICIKDGAELKESTIYYRYRGKSNPIKAGDLIHLINESKAKETQRWIELIQSASSIGVHKVGIFDSHSGEITSNRGNKFILDDKLLKRLKVINQYSVHKDGAEAVKIVGEIDQTGTIVKQSISIHDDDIIHSFLDNNVPNGPKEFLDALCYQSSGQMPIYFYLKASKMSIADGIVYLKSVNKRSQAKTRLINRLKDDSTLLNQKEVASINADTPIGKKRKQYYDLILSETEFNIDNTEVARRTLEAALNLTEGNYPQIFVKRKLKEIFDEYYDVKALCDLIRRAIAYLDLIENRENE